MEQNNKFIKKWQGQETHAHGNINKNQHMQDFYGMKFGSYEGPTLFICIYSIFKLYKVHSDFTDFY